MAYQINANLDDMVHPNISSHSYKFGKNPTGAYLTPEDVLTNLELPYTRMQTLLLDDYESETSFSFAATTNGVQGQIQVPQYLVFTGTLAYTLDLPDASKENCFVLIANARSAMLTVMYNDTILVTVEAGAMVILMPAGSTWKYWTGTPAVEDQVPKSVSADTTLSEKDSPVVYATATCEITLPDASLANSKQFTVINTLTTTSASDYVTVKYSTKSWRIMPGQSKTYCANTTTWYEVGEAFYAGTTLYL